MTWAKVSVRLPKPCAIFSPKEASFATPSSCWLCSTGRTMCVNHQSSKSVAVLPVAMLLIASIATGTVESARFTPFAAFAPASPMPRANWKPASPRTSGPLRSWKSGLSFGLTGFSSDQGMSHGARALDDSLPQSISHGIGAAAGAAFGLPVKSMPRSS
jgi:hypothetical protein